MNRECERVEQTKLHVPGEQRGNCFVATVSGLLKIPIEAIPEFATKGEISWQQQFNEWLRQFGLAWFPMAGDDLAGECQQFGIEGLWSEMSGKSPRFDVGHSCAAKDGRLAWDPHPSQSGLERPIWWHGMFVVLQPWSMVHSFPCNPSGIGPRPNLDGQLWIKSDLDPGVHYCHRNDCEVEEIDDYSEQLTCRVCGTKRVMEIPE